MIYKVFNQFTGEHEDFLDELGAKTRYKELIVLILTSFNFNPEKNIIKSNQRWSTDQLSAEHFYNDFFGVYCVGVYAYSILDIVNDSYKGRCFYFIESDRYVLIKVYNGTVLEIYQHFQNENRSVTFDLSTKQPIFYYLNNDSEKYDYYTNELMGTTSNVSSEKIPLPEYAQTFMDRYQNDFNIVGHGYRSYGYIIEYIESNEVELNSHYDVEYKSSIDKARDLISVVTEVLDDIGGFKTEIVDTSLWMN